LSRARVGRAKPFALAVVQSSCLKVASKKHSSRTRFLPHICALFTDYFHTHNLFINIKSAQLWRPTIKRAGLFSSATFPTVCDYPSFTRTRRADNPPGGTEELIIETLGRVGQVLNFRLVYDKETGRPKGFGFAEFADADAAASAVRNLNDYDLMGRKLRVDWSNESGSGDNAPSNRDQTTQPTMTMNGQQPAAPAPVQPSSALGPLPPGVDLPPNLTCPDAISRTLSTLPPDQLLDILSQMKGLVMTDPAKATELLRQAPQLAYAIFQSLLLLQLVDPQILTSLVETSAAPAPVAQAPPVQQVQQPPPQAARPPVNYPGYPPQVAPTPPQPQPPVAQPYAQPPPQQQAPGMDQQALYAQVMALSQQQIDQLAPEHRAQILQIRQMLMAGGRP
jgi:cleavage stimulation factor subunit 2